MATPIIKKMYNALKRYDHDPAVGMRLVRQNVRTEADLLAKIKWPHCNEDAALVAMLLEIPRAIPLLAAWLYQCKRMGYLRFLPQRPHRLASFSSATVLKRLIYATHYHPTSFVSGWAASDLGFRALYGDMGALPMLCNLYFTPKMFGYKRWRLAEVLIKFQAAHWAVEKALQSDDGDLVGPMIPSAMSINHPPFIALVEKLTDDPRPVLDDDGELWATVGEMATYWLDYLQKYPPNAKHKRVQRYLSVRNVDEHKHGEFSACRDDYFSEQWDIWFGWYDQDDDEDT